MTTPRTPPTYPAPKYGATPVYGTCETGHPRVARTTCPRCDGHFCLEHADHEKHA